MHLGVERDQPEDALIDYMIALEAILMADGNKPDIRYRLALRGAAACTSGPEERAEVFQAIWSDYNLRSRILHGDPRPPTFAASLALAVSKRESLLRTSLREYSMGGRLGEEVREGGGASHHPKRTTMSAVRSCGSFLALGACPSKGAHEIPDLSCSE